VLALRARQQRNFLAILMLSQGVPMLTAGDETGRTQGGNNNAYCQDNPTGWFDWRLVEDHADLVRFVARLIRFRKAHPSLRRRTFFDEDDPKSPGIQWHGPVHGKPDWSDASRALAFHLVGQNGGEDLFVALNAGEKALPFELPTAGRGRAWHRFLDTSLEPPDEIREPGEEAPLAGRVYLVGPRSAVVLVSRRPS
jgi:glycogen operon protein